MRRLGPDWNHRQGDSQRWLAAGRGEGNYSIGTSTPGEGVPPDGYYVTVLEDRGPVTSMKPATVNSKYTLPSDSGLLFKVEDGGETTFDIVLDPP
jgi:hypothetical protein